MAVTLLVVGILAVLAPTLVQGQGVDDELWRSVEACQKVVRKHISLADNTVSSALRQLADSNTTMEAYIKRWGARVVAGAGDPVTAGKVRDCEDVFLNSTRTVAAAMETKLRHSLQSQILWYDEKIFSLFTDVISDESRDALVETVKFHLEPTLKQFDSEAVSSLKQSIKDMKPAYQTVSSCIRTLSVKSDPWRDHHR